MEKCDLEIFNNGTPVALLDGRAVEVEEWVIKIRELSGQRVDWHYFGGRAVIKCLGDIQRVKFAIAVHPFKDRTI